MNSIVLSVENDENGNISINPFMCVERRIRPKYLKPTANLVAFFGALLRVPHVGFFGISEFRVPIQFSKTDIISQASGISSVYAMCFVCVCVFAHDVPPLYSIHMHMDGFMQMIFCL